MDTICLCKNKIIVNSPLLCVGCNVAVCTQCGLKNDVTLCAECLGKQQMPTCTKCNNPYNLADEESCLHCQANFCGIVCINAPHINCVKCAVNQCQRLVTYKCAKCHIWMCDLHNTYHYPNNCSENPDDLKRQQKAACRIIHSKCAVNVCFRRVCNCAPTNREMLSYVTHQMPLCVLHRQDTTMRCYGCNKKYYKNAHNDGCLTFRQITIPSYVLIPTTVQVCSLCFARAREAIHVLLLHRMPRHVIEDIVVMAMRAERHENMASWVTLKEIVGYRPHKPYICH